MYFLIRFQGTLSQGPNAGKSYTYDKSWDGVQFDTLEQARAKLVQYQAQEPGLQFRLVKRQWHGKGRGDGWREEILPI